MPLLLLRAELLLWISETAPCAVPLDLPTLVETVPPWQVTTVRAWADGRLYELSVPTYLPHGGTFTTTFWMDGLRQWPGVPIDLYATVGAVPAPHGCGAAARHVEGLASAEVRA